MFGFQSSGNEVPGDLECGPAGDVRYGPRNDGQWVEAEPSTKPESETTHLDDADSKADAIAHDCIVQGR